ncbi:hypothetical protein, partial [Streptomyces gibsoniae]
GAVIRRVAVGDFTQRLHIVVRGVTGRTVVVTRGITGRTDTVTRGACMASRGRRDFRNTP